MAPGSQDHDFEDVADARIAEARELFEDGDEEAAEELVVHVLRAFRRHGCIEARLEAIDLASEMAAALPEPPPILFEAAHHDDPIGEAARQALAELGLELDDSIEIDEDDEDEVLTEDFRRELDSDDDAEAYSDEDDDEDDEDYGFDDEDEDFGESDDFDGDEDFDDD